MYVPYAGNVKRKCIADTMLVCIKICRDCMAYLNSKRVARL